MSLKSILKTVILVLAVLVSSADASDVGLPPLPGGTPGLPGGIDLCELAGQPFCDPKPIVTCTLGSLIWPQCLMIEKPKNQQYPICHSKNWETCFKADLSNWGIFNEPSATSLITEVTSTSASIRSDKVYVNARGTTNTGGWNDIYLQPKAYLYPPADGIQEITFVGAKPSGLATMGFENISSSLVMLKPDWLKGVRIVASSNSIEVLLESDDISNLNVHGAGEYWPFPWGQIVIQ